MKILLVSATDLEIEKERFSDFEILITGIGMLNTSINLTQRLSSGKYDLLINIGVAGSFNSELNIGDVVEVVEDKISELGFEDGESFSEFNEFNLKNVFKNKSKTDLLSVKSITVNRVHGNQGSITEIINRLNPDIENMEGAAFFQVCNTFNVPCIQIRAISNKVEQRNKDNWNLPLAIKNLNNTVQEIIAEL
ncbi:MAG: futalosine hydrolase [Flavobacteriales bacterium]|nr:futalosine hydrolase [Flavobacteriales bacterium]|tara:strand:+ start:1302 stop:1880 length:579 start_codon:yes stop_codon:yes gene_type:complete